MELTLSTLLAESPAASKCFSFSLTRLHYVLPREQSHWKQEDRNRCNWIETVMKEMTTPAMMLTEQWETMSYDWADHGCQRHPHPLWQSVKKKSTTQTNGWDRERQTDSEREMKREREIKCEKEMTRETWRERDKQNDRQRQRVEERERERMVCLHKQSTHKPQLSHTYTQPQTHWMTQCWTGAPFIQSQ